MLKQILNLRSKLENNIFSVQECVNLLSNIEITESLNDFSNQISNWMLTNKLPKQLSVYNTFGQPPITLFNNNEFVIDLYFWMHADTSLHSHAFEGAFKVLYGQSLHEEFSIETKKKYTEDVQLNELRRINSQILKPGDVRTIERGDIFNHRVIHLSSPTVTLCIRTVKDVTVKQWHHFDNGLSILKRELDESVLKKIFYADYLHILNSKNSIDFTSNFVEALDYSETLNLFEQLSVDTMGLSDEYQETLYEVMISKLNATKWYGMYEEVCDQSPVFPENSSEKGKLLTHMINYSYTEEEKTRLLNDL